MQSNAANAPSVYCLTTSCEGEAFNHLSTFFFIQIQNYKYIFFTDSCLLRLNKIGVIIGLNVVVELTEQLVLTLG